MDNEQGKRPLLVTCFEPFGERQSSTSMRALGPWLKRAPTGISVRVLPVDFQALRRLVPHMLRDGAPSAWLMLGEHGGGDLLRCERVAVNTVDSPRPDNRGVVLHGSSAAHGPTLTVEPTSGRRGRGWLREIIGNFGDRARYMVQKT